MATPNPAEVEFGDNEALIPIKIEDDADDDRDAEDVGEDNADEIEIVESREENDGNPDNDNAEEVDAIPKDAEEELIRRGAIKPEEPKEPEDAERIEETEKPLINIGTSSPTDLVDAEGTPTEKSDGEEEEEEEEEGDDDESTSNNFTSEELRLQKLMKRRSDALRQIISQEDAETKRTAESLIEIVTNTRPISQQANMFHKQFMEVLELVGQRNQKRLESKYPNIRGLREGKMAMLEIDVQILEEVEASMSSNREYPWLAYLTSVASAIRVVETLAGTTTTRSNAALAYKLQAIEEFVRTRKSVAVHEGYHSPKAHSIYSLVDDNDDTDFGHHSMILTHESRAKILAVFRGDKTLPALQSCCYFVLEYRFDHKVHATRYFTLSGAMKDFGEIPTKVSFVLVPQIHGNVARSLLDNLGVSSKLTQGHHDKDKKKKEKRDKKADKKHNGSRDIGINGDRVVVFGDSGENGDEYETL